MVSLVDSMTGDHPARPVLVFSNNPGAGGLAKARSRDIPVAAIDHKAFKGDRAAFDAALGAELDRVSPDIICHAGFMRILTADFVRLWDGKMINIHPSLLPKYPGLNTHARALKARDQEAGCSVHQVIAELDAGPILGQARVPVLPGDTPGTLGARVLAQEHLLYPAVLARFAAGDKRPVFLPCKA